MGRSARSPRKRTTLPRRMVLAAAALILGGGGLAAVNVYASASEGDTGRSDPAAQGMGQMRMLSTIDCPDVGNSLSTVPDAAKSRVDRQLAVLDTQITDAYTKFADNKDRIQRDPALADTMVLAPLKQQRADSIGKIANDTGQADLKDKGLAVCTMRAADVADQGSGADQQSGVQGDGQNNGQSGDQNAVAAAQNNASGPVRADFVDIRSVRPNVSTPAPGAAPPPAPSPATAAATRTANATPTTSSSLRA